MGFVRLTWWATDTTLNCPLRIVWTEAGEPLKREQLKAWRIKHGHKQDATQAFASFFGPPFDAARVSTKTGRLRPRPRPRPGLKHGPAPSPGPPARAPFGLAAGSLRLSAWDDGSAGNEPDKRT